MQGGSQDILIRQSAWRAVLPAVATFLAFSFVGGGMLAFGLWLSGTVFVLPAVVVAAAGALGYSPGNVVLAANDRGLTYRVLPFRVDVPWSEVLGAEIQMLDDGDGDRRPSLIVGIRNRDRIVVEGRFSTCVLSRRRLRATPKWEQTLWLGDNSSWKWDPEEVCRIINHFAKRERGEDRRS